MHTCRACGAIIGRQFRFCSQCGAPVGADLNLLDVGPVVREEATVSHGQSGRFWATVIGGVVAVGFGVWLVGRLGGADSAAPEPVRSTTTTEVPPSTTVPDGPTNATDPNATDPNAAGTSTTAPADAPAPSQILGDGQPLLGQPVGLSVMIGSDASLRRVDLDTGAVYEYPIRGMPVAVSGPWLLLQEPNGGPLDAVTLNDFATPGKELTNPSYYVAATAPGPEPGQIWILEYGDQPSWRLMRIDDGTTVARIAVDNQDIPYISPEPDLTGTPGGGVFLREGDSYRRVADGQLVAASDAYILTETCTQPTQCQLHWIDRSTWQSVNRALPADQDRPGLIRPGAFLSPGGRMLGYTASPGQGRLFDVGRSRSIPSIADPSSMVASPDGRFVATPEAGRVQVYDTETGAIHDLVLGLVAASRVVFVPTASFGTAG